MASKTNKIKRFVIYPLLFLAAMFGVYALYASVLIYKGVEPLPRPRYGRQAIKPWPKKEPRHILVLSLDALRPDHMGAYGYDRLTTPNVDKLAAEGVQYFNHFAPLGSTYYSLRTLLSGYAPSAYTIPGKQVYLPGSLESRGFVTGRFYKVPGVPFEHDFYHELAEQSVRPFFERSFPRKILRLLEKRNDRDYGPMTVNTKVALLEYQRPHIVEFFAKNNDHRVFAFVHSEDGHYPFRLLRRNYQFVPDGAINDKAAWQWTLRDGYVDEVRRRFDEDPRPTEEKLDILIGYYDSVIAEWDRQVGLLLDELKALGVLRDTLVIITSDHGEEFLEHGNLLHCQTVVPEQIRVPLIAYWPKGGKAWRGGINKGISSHEMLEWSIESVTREGTGLILPTWQGPPESPIYLGVCPGNNYYDGKVDKPAGILTGGGVLFATTFDKFTGEMGEASLYHLKNDPMGKNDLSAEYPEQTAKFKELLANHCAAN